MTQFFTQNHPLFCHSTGSCVPTAVTEDPDDLEEDDDSADDEADDNGRVYKNPRNFPSPGKLF